MTESYEKKNLDYRRIRLGIWQACGMATMFELSDAPTVMQPSGLELQENMDLVLTMSKLIL